MAIETPVVISALPPVPVLSDISTFSARTDLFINALPDFRTQNNDLAANVYHNALELAGQAAAASGSASAASASATAANDSAIAAAASALAASGSALDASASATAANDSAVAAAASTVSASSLAAGITSTSTSSITVGTGSKSFTTQSGKQYTTGIWINIVSAGTPTNWMFGQVSSYTSTTLIVEVTSTGGSGTAADWNISISGAQGVQGIPGTGVTPQAVGFIAVGGTDARTLTVDSNITTSNIVTLSEAQTLTNKKLSTYYIIDKTVDTASAAGTVNLDVSTATVFNLTLSGNTTLAVINAPTLSNETLTFIVKVTQPGSAYTLTWWSGITWITSGGSAPAAPAASKTIEYIFTSSSAGVYEGRKGAST